MSAVTQLRPSAKESYVIPRQIDGDTYDRIAIQLPRIEAMLHILTLSLDCRHSQPGVVVLEDAIGGISSMVEAVRKDFDGLVVEVAA